jgi:hypothetical protein
VHCVHCRRFFSALAAAAEFVETEPGEWTYQRKAGSQRKEQRQQRMAKDRPEDNKTENGIDQAEDNGVGWDGLEVFPAQAQRVGQVGKADLANDKSGGDAEQL